MNTKIMNMDAVTPQDMAEVIANNRWMAKEQLDMDDMGKTLWKQYCQLCDNVAVESWNSLNNKCDEDVLATSLKLLFNFFGCDVKATPMVQKRFLLACVTIKKFSSDDMKKARKELRQARVALNDPAEDSNLEQLQIAVDKAKAEVERLEALPKHYWSDPTPLLKDKKHATKDCRKKIEDAMADLISERSLMTAEELAAEELALKMTRKANKKIKAQKKDAEVITDADAK